LPKQQLTGDDFSVNLNTAKIPSGGLPHHGELDYSSLSGININHVNKTVWEEIPPYPRFLLF
jgi:hypothetical protein